MAPHPDDQKQKLVRLLGPLITDDNNEDGYLNWMMQAHSYDDMKKSAEYAVSLIRQQVGVPNLQWDDSLAEDARNWANYCASINTMQHADWEQRKHQGENIWSGTEWSGYGFKGAEQSNGQNANGNVFLEAVLSWCIDNEGNGDGMSEKDRFDRQTGGMDGHYTQTVWKSTTKFGLGFCLYGQRSEHFGYKCMVVGRFSPSGNMNGERPY